MHAVVRAINIAKILTTLICILYSIAEPNTSRQVLAGLVQCRYNAPHRNLVRLLRSNKLSCKLVSINSEELRTIQNQLQNYISALLKEISSHREELMNLKWLMESWELIIYQLCPAGTYLPRTIMLPRSIIGYL